MPRFDPWGSLKPYQVFRSETALTVPWAPPYVREDMRRHKRASPLDVPEYSIGSQQAVWLVRLAWRLWTRGTSEDEAVEALRLKAVSDPDQLWIAEWNLRATGYVAENFDYYECWRLLCRASGATPAPLPPENQRLAEAVEEFLQPTTSQLAFLSSKVPALSEVLATVKANHGDAYIEARKALSQLVGPQSRNSDPFVRSNTVRDVVFTELSRLEMTSTLREASRRKPKPRR